MRMRFSPTPRRLLLVCLLLAGGSQTVQAAAVYDVEIIVFRHKLVTDAGEHWPAVARTEPQGSGIMPQDGFGELDRSLYQLDGVRGGLRNSSGYEVLLHRAWRQVGYDAAHAIAYPINSNSESGRYHIEGSVKLVRERYLHLDVDLFLTAGGNAPPGQYSDGAGDARVYELNEKRRIRSRELHYFDHPRFGMIALVTPYDAPEDEPEPDTAVETMESETLDEPADNGNDDQLTR